MRSNMAKGLYIHIPFCKYICSYCDFGKKYIKNQPVDDYVAALITEIELHGQFDDVDTIYIGGGTPSSLNSDQLQLIFSSLKRHVNLDNIVEFTFEMNPDDVNQPLLKLLKANGVNRLSIGAQTLNDQILTSLNRLHTSSDVTKAITLAQSLFDNVSVDFMFNLPNQTVDDIDKSLELIKEMGITHVSYYGLIFEEHTILSTENHKYWDEDYESQIYTYIQTKLQDIGYNQYEISNYALGDYQSKHNIHYWNHDQYYGIGLSSSGFIDNRRYTNTYSLKSYIDKLSNRELPQGEHEVLTADDIQFEKIMLGLRYYQFVSLNPQLITKIKADQFLGNKFDFRDNSIRLKPEFYYISNQIIIDILERIEC